MVERDARDDDDSRVENVGGIVPAAEPGLDDRDVDIRRGERASAAAVSASNCVAPSASAADRTAAIAASKSVSSPPMRIRSPQPRTCGER